MWRGSTSSITNPRRAGLSTACDDADGQRHQVDDREWRPASDSASTPEKHRQRSLTALGHHRHLALVDPVGDRPGPDPEHEHRQELAEQRDAHVGGLAGQPIHQERDRSHLDPRADVAEAEPEEEQPCVAMLQRAEHLRLSHRCISTGNGCKGGNSAGSRKEAGGTVRGVPVAVRGRRTVLAAIVLILASCSSPSPENPEVRAGAVYDTIVRWFAEVVDHRSRSTSRLHRTSRRRGLHPPRRAGRIGQVDPRRRHRAFHRFP